MLVVMDLSGIRPQQSGELVYIKRKLNGWQALLVTFPHLVHRYIFLQPDLRVGPCPTLTRAIDESYPEQVVFLPVVNQEVRLGWAFGGVHWDGGVKLDDHLPSNACLARSSHPPTPCAPMPWPVP